MIEMADNHSKTWSVEKYLSQWRTDEIPILDFIKEHANHPNWKIRNVMVEITEKLAGITLKNLQYENFE